MTFPAIKVWMHDRLSLGSLRFNVFETSLLLSLGLHLFDQNSNIINDNKITVFYLIIFYNVIYSSDGKN